MNILSQDEKTLINYNNIVNLCIQKKYKQYSYPDTWWEIRAMYPVPSNNDDLLYDIVAQFDNEEKCESVFKEIVHQIGFLRYNLIRVSDI